MNNSIQHQLNNLSIHSCILFFQWSHFPPTRDTTTSRCQCPPAHPHAQRERSRDYHAIAARMLPADIVVPGGTVLLLDPSPPRRWK